MSRKIKQGCFIKIKEVSLGFVTFKNKSIKKQKKMLKKGYCPALDIDYQDGDVACLLPEFWQDYLR